MKISDSFFGPTLLALSTVTVLVAPGCNGAASFPPVNGGQSGAPFTVTQGASAAEVQLYKFRGAPDGANPYAELITVNGTFYGTTEYGGYIGYGCGNVGYGAGCGTVFSITKSGQEKVLYRFRGGTDGQLPASGLIAVNGLLYGTTYNGGDPDCGQGLGYGTPGCGTVFSVSPSGREKVVWRFKGGLDGAFPVDRLVAMNGVLYGASAEGGSGSCGFYHCGTVFSVSTSGQEKILHNFQGGKDGRFPGTGLSVMDGVLYGTTTSGGTGECGLSSHVGCGVVFSVSTSGQERVLYSFKGSPDGVSPYADLLAVKGVLYGTTPFGGAGCPYGCGTVFSVTRSGQEKVLYSFKASPDANDPYAGLIAVNAVLYGTTDGGGSSKFGTIFRVSMSGQEKVLYSFKGGADGRNPVRPLIDVHGVLYGTTNHGGGSGCAGLGCGTVFKLSL